MTTNYTNSRYALSMVILHWFTLILLIAVFGFIELRELFEKGTEARELMKSIHYTLGLTVLLTVIVRLYFRLTTKVPLIQPAPHWVSKNLGAAMHAALYLIMLGLPIAGWLMLSAAGKPIPFSGLELPALITENEALADQIKDIHKTIGNLTYFLIAAHAFAGLYHHYIRHDDTLRRILPKPNKSKNKLASRLEY
ncbi:MAG: cytochrome b [Methylophilaceae bacterium]|nr:cytochrome b [Methylophilaceae bacterium]